MTDRPAAPRRRWIAGALLLATAGLALGEGLPRVLGMGPFRFGWPRGMFQADPLLGIRMRPGFQGTQVEDDFRVAVRVNRLGLRGPEAPPPSEAAARAPRILCLGDAATFGHGVEEDDAWPARLERELHTRGLAGARVWNGACMSYGPRQESRWLAKLAPELGPDLVLVGFSIANDFFDCLGTPLTVHEGWPVGADFPGFTPALRMRWWLKYHSTLWRLLASLLDEPEVPLRCSWHPAFGIEAFRIAPTPAMQRALEKLRGIWRDELRPAAARAGAKVAIVPLPTRFQILPSFWQDHVDRCELDAMLFDRTLPQRRLRDLAATMDLPVIDPREALLAAAARGESPYRTRKILQAHLTPAGHRVIARRVADGLLAAGLLAADG